MLKRGRRQSDPVPPSSLRTALTQALSTTLASSDSPRVVVIAPGAASDVRRHVTTQRPSARVHVVGAGLEGSDRHVALAAAGPIDLLVDRSPKPAMPGRTADLIRYVRAGGVLLGRLPKRAGEGDAEERAAYAASLRERLDDLVGDLTLLERHVLAVSAIQKRPIIREAEVAALLERRPDLGRVVETRPEQQVTGRGAVRMNRDDQRFPVITAWTTPPLALREYRDAVSAPGQVVSSGDLLLPESFRHVFRRLVKNKWLSPRPMHLFADPGLARAPRHCEPAPEDRPRRLEGSYFHLDNELAGHFGHTTTEVLAKVWGWYVAKQNDPALKALVHANSSRGVPAEWEFALLEAAGIPREEIVFTRDPVQVDRLVGATQMFGNPRYAHPDLVPLWRTVGNNLEAQASLDAAELPGRIFVSRRAGGRRSCRNLAQVNEFFEGLGYTVVYPEEYSISDQVRLFRSARAIAGFAGSGMFGLMWCAGPKPVTLVAPDLYPGRNEFLIAELIGHGLDVVWCPADGTDPETGQRVRGIEAPFSVDLDRDAGFIRRAAARAAG